MSRARRLFTVVTVLAAWASSAAAQEWSADVYAGGSRYDAIGARASSAGHVVANLRVSVPRSAAFLAAAVPLGSDSPMWTALGGETRLMRHVGVADVGFRLAGDGFLYRHSDIASGRGASLHVLPFVAFRQGPLDVEIQGGRRDFILRDDVGTFRRHVYEAGGTASTSIGPAFVAAQVRNMASDGVMFPFAGVQASVTRGTVALWGGVGRWFGDELAESTWQAGASLDVGARGEVWIGVQHAAADPLYLSPSRSTWNVGYTRRLRSSAVPDLAAPVVRDARLIVRLPRAGRAAQGPVSVAGEFSGWAPVSMALAGDAWEVAIPVGSGVARFAFVDRSGEWFVPDGFPGRIDDGMGGHVVVVVVP